MDWGLFFVGVVVVAGCICYCEPFQELH